MMSFGDPTSLSLLYHLNSEPWQNTEAYQNAGYEIEYKEAEDRDGEVRLAAELSSSLLDTIRARYSCRQFRSDILPLDTLALLLRGTYGILRTDYQIYGGFPTWLRGVPSAGGLFPLELYLLSQRVNELADGLYHYNVRRHSLEPLKTARFADFESVLYNYPFIENANIVLLMSAVFPRIQKKYGPRGYRYLLLEAGHAAQNLCLLATTQGLASLCMGGYADARLNAMLGLNPAEEGVVYSVAAGWPSASPEVPFS
jgi:SagB-type dehydrogenase family enzyme